MEKKIWFYLSEYGYGHTIRCFELIKALLHKDPNLQIEIRNKIDETLIRQNKKFLGKVKTEKLKMGIKSGGLLHSDQFKITLRELNQTADVLYDFFKNEEEDLVESEAKTAIDEKPDLIVADIPFYAFKIAKRAGIPIIGFSDYLWNIVYEPFQEINKKFEFITNHIAESYLEMDLLIHYPPKTPMDEKIKSTEVEFVCRKPKHTKSETRKKIGVDEEKIMVMTVIRDLRLEVSEELVKKYPNIVFMSAQEIKNFELFEPEKFGLSHIDLMNASDLIISKPGYSLLGDLLPSQKPVLLVDREDFAEDPYLIETIKKHIPYCFRFRTNDFLSGDWEPYIEHFLNREVKKVPKDYRINGAEQASHIITKQFLGY